MFRKEWLTEMRSKHGLFTSFLFSLLAVVAMSIASFGSSPKASVAAGMLCVTVLFSSVVALPRCFLLEDEQGTFDLLRLATEPTAMFSGKLLYNFVQGLISVSVLAVLFVTMTGVQVVNTPLFVCGCGFTALAVCGGVSVCGALVIGATNRWLLGTAAALPILLPQVFLGMGALRASMGQGTTGSGWTSVLGLFGWALVIAAAGPLLVAAAWKSDH